MRKLILQVQVSIDGFMARTAGDPSWMVWNWGNRLTWDVHLKRDFVRNLERVDCVLLSSTLAKGGFIDHWELAAATTGDDRRAYAAELKGKHKVVFSSTLKESGWPNSELATGGLEVEVNRLKADEGKDLIVYGRASFVSALTRAGLVDEFQIYATRSPSATGCPSSAARTPSTWS